MRTIGRYSLFAEIASGGMASIHIGRLLGPVGFSRTVAIKRLHAQFAKDPEFVTMFLDEARLAARIRHPNVVPTIDVVATEGELFLVMDYIQGVSLAQLARNMQAADTLVPQEIVRAIMSGVLHGLHAAHEAKNERGEPLGIVHRDVSPQNILVGADGVARLIDFGIAKAIGRCHVTRDRYLKGKLSYMAPEQIDNASVDQRTDVYAASVVLWELLTGRRLFDADTEPSKLVRVLTSAVARPSSIVPAIPASLDALVLRGMNRDPKRRFASARELALALEASGRMASPSKVGAWVEATAHEQLAARAAHVTAVEQMHDMSSEIIASPQELLAVKTAANEMPTVVGPANGESSGLGSASESESTRTDAEIEPQRGPRNSLLTRKLWLRRALGAFGLSLILAATAFWRTCSHPSQDITQQKSADASGKQQAEPSLEVVEPPPAGASTERVSSPILDIDRVPPEPTASSEPHDKAEKKPSSSKQAGAVRSKAKLADCNPPFILDAAGIRHYKRQCL